ncbi:hypothetical protein NEMBOFW57_009259 [Staphylotrichum longicolle]|uniref:Uncharacterized protein n=1 Tax=Staphylotrichum longicolle TaxID=669026 RepID=A0AAD4ENT0_9PEZI|nr:hypothetical protein NEMBOFW57_009259 [Staphylotrichum longicolle]
MEAECFYVAAAILNTFVTNNGMIVGVRKTPAARPPSRTARRRSRSRDATVTIPALRQGLAYLSLLVPAYVHAQAFVGGDLSIQAPWGLPAADFAAAVSTPSSDATFTITGYNTSLPAGSVKATDDEVSGWSLNIGVTANVPLAGSNLNTVDKSLCIDATALSITPPGGVAAFSSSGWRVCAIVFTDGLAGSANTRSDGSCSAALPDDCIRELQSNSVAAKQGRTGGGCQDLDIPEGCAGHFGGKHGTAFEITPISNSSFAADRRSMFFAAGFDPIQRGNQSALLAAQRRVWPVVLTWTHFDENGAVRDSTGHLSCAKTTGSKEVSSDGEVEAVVGIAFYGTLFGSVILLVIGAELLGIVVFFFWFVIFTLWRIIEAVTGLKLENLIAGDFC